jgi:hypothetical protein
LSTLAYGYAVAGMRPQADEAVDALVRMAGERYTSSFALALAHLGAGRSEVALDHLEQAFEERSDSMAILAAYPPLDPLRGHPRFQALMTRAGLPPGTFD